MKLLLTAVLTAFCLNAAAADATVAKSISFSGKDAIADIQSGKVTTSIRLSDRTVAPFGYKVGQVMPLINTDKTQETRTEDEQIAAEAYKYVEFTKITVSQLSALPQAAQDEIKKFYPQDKIDAAKGIVSQITFKYRASK